MTSPPEHRNARSAAIDAGTSEHDQTQVSSQATADDADVIAQAIRNRREAVEFFSHRMKPERELWVANEFLANLALGFERSELILATDEPPDIHFRDARFEIKEILEPGRRRHDEYRESLARAESATSAGELYEPAEPRDITDAEICELVRQSAEALKQKYAPGARSTLDLLCYVNLDNVFGYVRADLPSNDSWASFGFRSICFVAGRLGGVLAYSEQSPAFLQDGGVRVVRSGRSVEEARARG